MVHAGHIGEIMYVYKTAVSRRTERDRFRKLSGHRHKSMCLVNQHASLKLKHREVAYSRHT